MVSWGPLSLVGICAGILAFSRDSAGSASLQSLFVAGLTAGAVATVLANALGNLLSSRPLRARLAVGFAALVLALVSSVWATLMRPDPRWEAVWLLWGPALLAAVLVSRRARRSATLPARSLARGSLERGMWNDGCAVIVGAALLTLVKPSAGPWSFVVLVVALVVALGVFGVQGRAWLRLRALLVGVASVPEPAARTELSVIELGLGDGWYSRAQPRTAYRSRMGDLLHGDPKRLARLLKVELGYGLLICGAATLGGFAHERRSPEREQSSVEQASSGGSCPLYRSAALRYGGVRTE